MYNRESIVLTRKQLESLVDENAYDWNDDTNNYDVLFEEVEDTKQITNQNRWTLDWEKVIKRLNDNKYFFIYWSEPATETCGYFSDCNREEEYEFEEVFPVTKTITFYE